MSKADILGNVWDFDFDGDPNIVEVYIRHLRNKVDWPLRRAGRDRDAARCGLPAGRPRWLGAGCPCACARPSPRPPSSGSRSPSARCSSCDSPRTPRRERRRDGGAGCRGDRRALLESSGSTRLPEVDDALQRPGTADALVTVSDDADDVDPPRGDPPPPGDPRRRAARRRRRARSRSATASTTLRVALPLDDALGASATVTGLLRGLGALLLVVLAGVTWLVVGRALRPVETMRREVDGDRARRARPAARRAGSRRRGGPRSARTMNRMLARLDGAARASAGSSPTRRTSSRSPLASIRQYAELARAHPEAIDAAELAGVVLAEGARLQELVEVAAAARAARRGRGGRPSRQPSTSTTSCSRMPGGCATPRGRARLPRRLRRRASPETSGCSRGSPATSPTTPRGMRARAVALAAGGRGLGRARRRGRRRGHPRVRAERASSGSCDSTRPRARRGRQRPGGSRSSPRSRGRTAGPRGSRASPLGGARFVVAAAVRAG